jgi:hypothetical protein
MPMLGNGPETSLQGECKSIIPAEQSSRGTIMGRAAYAVTRSGTRRPPALAFTAFSAIESSRPASPAS